MFRNYSVSIFQYFGILFLTTTIIACSSNMHDDNRQDIEMTEKTIKEVLEEHTDNLMSFSGVVGTGQGICNDKPCIKVYVSQKTSELDKKIPKYLDGYKVIIEVIGKIRAHPKNQE